MAARLSREMHRAVVTSAWNKQLLQSNGQNRWSLVLAPGLT